MKILKALISFLFISVLINNGYCIDLYITNIKKQENKSYLIELNNTMLLYNIKLNNTKTDIVVPSYNNKNKQYKYFVFLDRSFKNKLIDNISNNIIDEKTSNIEYKINKFNVINSKVLKATFSVIFNDLLEVNATILNGKNGIWVSWPSVKQDNKWNKLFVIKDKKLKASIENEIINKYNKEIEND